MPFPYTQNPMAFNASQGSDVPVHFRNQYNNYVIDLAQQEHSLLMGKFEQASIQGNQLIYDFSGPKDLNERTTRYGETSYTEPDESRRIMNLKAYNLAFLVEDFDAQMMVEDPKGVYVRKMAAAVGRKYDDYVFSKFFADVISGHNNDANASTVSWNAANADATIIISTRSTGLTLEALSEAARSLDEGEWMYGQQRYAIVPPVGVHQLLMKTEVGSIDFNTVKALVAGEFNTYYGFEFIKSNRVPKTDDGKYWRCIFCVKDAMRVGWLDKGVDMRPNPQMNHKMSIYKEIAVGALRTQESAIVEVQIPVAGGIQAVN